MLFVLFLSYCRKELKDPDQLYSTLKTILQHVKVSETYTHTLTQRTCTRTTFILTKCFWMPQSHQNAWPFMEPVKKTEAPGYYQVIRFPMGVYTSMQG